MPNDLIRSCKPEEIVVKIRQVDVANSLNFTGHRADATKVQTLGLFNEVIPDSNLTERAQELTEAIASGPPLTIRFKNDNIDRAIRDDLRLFRPTRD